MSLAEKMYVASNVVFVFVMYHLNAAFFVMYNLHAVLMLISCSSHVFLEKSVCSSHVPLMFSLRSLSVS